MKVNRHISLKRKTTSPGSVKFYSSFLKSTGQSSKELYEEGGDSRRSRRQSGMFAGLVLREVFKNMEQPKGENAMKKLTVLIMTLFLIATSVYANDVIMKKKAGNYTVEAQLGKTPPAVGENTLTVRIKDASGRLVTDKKVKVEYFMTERVSPTRKNVEMPYMQSEAASAPQDSVYKADLNFSMAGPWNIVVKIADGEKTKKAKFHVNVK